MEKIQILKDTPNGNGQIDAVSFIEEHYPETAKEFKKIQEEQYETFCKKQMDYGPSNISMGTGVGKSVDKKLATTALVIRINDKIQRLLNLVLDRRDPQNESIDDNLIDIANYAVMALLVRGKEWGK